MEKTDWKDMLGSAFGIDPASVESETEPEAAEAEPHPGAMRLNIQLDKRNRNGKKVTLITDFTGSDEALKRLAKELKTQCGVGGSARCGEILIQGDFREKVLGILKEKGYRARII